MSEQPKALQLADWMQNAVQTYPQMSEDEPGGYYTEADQVMDEAAAELRRLYALCEEMGEALDCLIAVYDGGDTGSIVESSIDKCRRALAKWKESK